MHPIVSFTEAEHGLLAGDFSRMAPAFARNGGDDPLVVQWHKAKLFTNKPEALNEAFTCACFNGCIDVAAYLLETGVEPSGGMKTGMNAFHWAANRGHLEIVRLLIGANAPMEIRNMYGGTVLDCTVWSAINEPRGRQMEVIEELIRAGADVNAVERPTGSPEIDALLAKGSR